MSVIYRTLPIQGMRTMEYKILKNRVIMYRVSGYTWGRWGTLAPKQTADEWLHLHVPTFTVAVAE